jgi:hypothetical protein
LGAGQGLLLGIHGGNKSIYNLSFDGKIYHNFGYYRRYNKREKIFLQKLSTQKFK